MTEYEEMREREKKEREETYAKLAGFFSAMAENDKFYKEQKQKKEREAYRQEYNEYNSKLSQKEKQFNLIRQNFESENQVSPKARQLLKLVEARSYQNHGDTKWSDSSIMKETKWSRSTVHRAFVELETHGFVMRLTKRGFNHKVKGFYSNRAIRCFRVLLTCRCKVFSSEQLKWKTDPRPPFNPKFMRSVDGKEVDRYWTNPPQDVDINEYIDRLVGAGVHTIDEDFREKMNFYRGCRDKRAFNIMGSAPKEKFNECYINIFN